MDFHYLIQTINSIDSNTSRLGMMGDMLTQSSDNIIPKLGIFDALINGKMSAYIQRFANYLLEINNINERLENAEQKEEIAELITKHKMFHDCILQDVRHMFTEFGTRYIDSSIELDEMDVGNIITMVFHDCNSENYKMLLARYNINSSAARYVNCTIMMDILKYENKKIYSLANTIDKRPNSIMISDISNAINRRDDHIYWRTIKT